MTDQKHDLEYDGTISDLYKIYLLNLFFTIITLGFYHFWGKTRKRRYISSSIQLQHDRFEYTGYGSELFYALLLGILMLFLISIPLFWSMYTIHQITHEHSTVNENDNIKNHDYEEDEAGYHIEQYDHFKKNRIIIDFKNAHDFWVVINQTGFEFNYKDETLYVEYMSQKSYGFVDIPIRFKPKEHFDFLIALLLIPTYIIFYAIFLPYLVTFGSLKYRATRTRWRGIRGDLHGSAILYALKGTILTLLNIITLGFWIAISDYQLFKYKMNRLHFGNQIFEFKPSFQNLMMFHLATIGASAYMIALVYALGYWNLSVIANYVPEQSLILQDFIMKITEKGYVIFAMILIWLCYIPRYWYRAALLREKYNSLSINGIRFSCHVSGKEYFKLFLINDLLFIFTIGLALPYIWNRRMKFISQHIKVHGDLRSLDIKQAGGKKTKFGGGLATVMNLDIGLI